jgi:hypothetical protein
MRIHNGKNYFSNVFDLRVRNYFRTVVDRHRMRARACRCGKDAQRDERADAK